jgi:serine/threonine protein kinase
MATGDMLSEAQCGYVVLGTLKGLCHLHALHILHLDIKAANILLTDAGEVKLGMMKIKYGLLLSCVYDKL